MGPGHGGALVGLCKELVKFLVLLVGDLLGAASPDGLVLVLELKLELFLADGLGGDLFLFIYLNFSLDGQCKNGKPSLQCHPR